MPSRLLSEFLFFVAKFRVFLDCPFQLGQSAKVKECDVDFNAKKGELKNKFYCGDEAAKMKYLARFSPNF